MFSEYICSVCFCHQCLSSRTLSSLQKETFMPWLLPLIVFFVPGTHQSTFFFATYFYFMYLFETWSCIVRWPWTPCSPISTFQVLACATACSSGCCLFLDGVRIESRASCMCVSCKCVHSGHFIQMESDNMVLFNPASLTWCNLYKVCLYCTMYY